MLFVANTRSSFGPVVVTVEGNEAEDGRKSHSEGELGTVAECGVVWAVDRRLSGESGVKLAHVLV